MVARKTKVFSMCFFSAIFFRIILFVRMSKFPTPSFSNLTTNDFDRVYEPAEDTFLLIDALEKDELLIQQKQYGCFYLFFSFLYKIFLFSGLIFTLSRFSIYSKSSKSLLYLLYSFYFIFILNRLVKITNYNQFIYSTRPSIALEIGPGSGIVITFLAKHITPRIACL